MFLKLFSPILATKTAAFQLILGFSMGQNASPRACLSIPSNLRPPLVKHIFNPFLTHFSSHNGHFSRHLWIVHGPKRVTRSSTWACLNIPNGLGSLLKKFVFDPFWTHFWSQNDPFSRHFGIFHGPKRVTTGSKLAKITCLSIPSGLGTILENMIFFAPGTPVDPPLAPTVRGPGRPRAPSSEHCYGGLGISLADSDAWKPQKVGGCGWTRCPRNWVLSHIAPQDTARSWFWACLT